MSTPPAAAGVVAPAEKQSLWDFIFQKKADGVKSYLDVLAARDAAEGTTLVNRILDQRVEQSVRFKFYNPVMGQHGYHHVLSTPALLAPKGSSPLHWAIIMRDPACMTVLLNFCADVTCQDENGITPYRLIWDLDPSGKEKEAREAMLVAFRQYREVVQRNRRQLLVLSARITYASPSKLQQAPQLHI
jgi:hypothetical protein